MPLRVHGKVVVSSHYLSHNHSLFQSHPTEGEKLPSQVFERCAQMIDLVVNDKETVVDTCACGSQIRLAASLCETIGLQNQ